MEEFTLCPSLVLVVFRDMGQKLGVPVPSEGRCNTASSCMSSFIKIDDRLHQLEYYALRQLSMSLTSFSFLIYPTSKGSTLS